MKITICPSCGSQSIQQVQRDWTGEYQGKTYIVPALTFHECPECGERIYDKEAMLKIEQSSPAFDATVSRKKKAVRTKTKQTQKSSRKDLEKV